MVPQAPELEQRVLELQSQLDTLTVSLREWQESQERLKPVEHQLSELSARGSEILDSWMALSQRHADAVASLEARLSDLTAVDTRYEQDAARRLRELGQIIENEWRALRELHREPVHELREQAASLTEMSLATANAAQTSIDRTEARLAALETTMHEHMAELARQVHTALAELRQSGPPWSGPKPAGTAAWPLDGVMRLHQQLREADGQPASGLSTRKEPPALEAPSTPPPALLKRVESLERTLEEERTALREATERTTRAGRSGQYAVGLLVVGLLAGTGLVWWAQAQARASAARAAAAEEEGRRTAAAAEQRIAAARADAEREAATARETAARAQIVSDILTAPDLVRVLLQGGPEGMRYTGQLLWSRSRGLVFTTSRLPAAPDGTYVLWLTTTTAPVKVKPLMPDATGRISIALETPPRPAGAVTGALVTLESSADGEAPSGETILSRMP